MAGTLITTVSKASVHALAFQGILVYASFPQIRDMLRNKFGEEYVLLFAEPVENVQNGELDWYTPVQGTPQKLENLPPDQRAPISAAIHTMAHEIAEYANELIHSPDPLKVTRGNILKLALSYPDDSYIYAVGQQPVFCCWGFGPGTPGVEPKSLTRLAQPVAPPTSPPQTPAPAVSPESAPTTVATASGSAARVWSWLWWLLPVALACLLLWLLFTSFGSLPALAGKTLFRGPELPFLDDTGDKSAELAKLKQEIADLQFKFDRHIALCKPEKPEPVVEPMAPRQEEALVIPENAEDTSFMEGKWLCETGLANSRTGEPVVVEFTFNAHGQGNCTIREQNNNCTGIAQAQMDNGHLSISHGELRCDHGNAYAPQRIICTNASGATTSCQGQAPGGQPWDASFHRIH